MINTEPTECEAEEGVEGDGAGVTVMDDMTLKLIEKTGSHIS